MPRLFPLSQLALLVCAATLPLGCHSIYRDVYSPRGNRFVPLPEKKTELPIDKKAVPPTPAANAAPAAADQNAIPGLAPAPDAMAPPPPLLPAM